MRRKTRQIGLKVGKKGIVGFAMEGALQMRAQIVALEELLRRGCVGLVGEFDGNPRLSGG